MAAYDGKYNRTEITIGNIVIDYIEFDKANDLEELRNKDKRWMINPTDRSELWVHFENHNPPFTFMSFKSGLLMGFSLFKSELIGKIKTYPLLLSIPEIEDSADLQQYQRMAFASGNIEIDNGSGILDELFLLFGNDINLSEMDDNNELKLIRQFFIENYTVGMVKSNFRVKDKRARLSFKAPNKYYTKEEYKFISDNLVDKIQLDAYGYCKGVTGTCVNRNQIYNPPQYVPANGFNNWFEFKFARKITSIESVWVEMSDIWTQVFPGLGVPNDPQYQDNWHNTNPNPIQLVCKDQSGKEYTITVDDGNKDHLGDYDNDGRIRIWHSQAMKDNPGHLERRNGDANKVKMNGVFVDLHTPKDIIKDLMSYYGGIDGDNFNNAVWDDELSSMKPIGICLETSRSVFDWIELIQNGSLLGFQMLIDKDKFSVRVDNANREETFNIRWNEMLNKNTLTPEINGDNYATFTTINYMKDYTDDKTLTITDNSKRLDILDIYKFEKEYSNESFLINKTDVEKKGKVILENYTMVKPIIRNIELDGIKRDNEYFLFATGWIDFTMELPRQMKIIQRYMKTRKFLDKLRVKIIKIRRNYITNKTYIDVIKCDKLNSLEAL